MHGAPLSVHEHKRRRALSEDYVTCCTGLLFLSPPVRARFHPFSFSTIHLLDLSKGHSPTLTMRDPIYNQPPVPTYSSTSQHRTLPSTSYVPRSPAVPRKFPSFGADNSFEYPQDFEGDISMESVTTSAFGQGLNDLSFGAPNAHSELSGCHRYIKS